MLEQLNFLTLRGGCFDKLVEVDTPTPLRSCSRNVLSSFFVARPSWECRCRRLPLCTPTLSWTKPTGLELVVVMSRARQDLGGALRHLQHDVEHHRCKILGLIGSTLGQSGSVVLVAHVLSNPRLLSSSTVKVVGVAVARVDQAEV